jgi:tetratricopeptide (TPR) repeat protein
LDDDVLRNMNMGPGITILSSDDLVAGEAALQSFSNLERNLYTWQPEVFSGEPAITEWNIPYQQVFNANLVLERIEKVVPRNPTEEQKKNVVKGRALFYRAFAFHCLAECFAAPYGASEPSATPGIPLRLNANVNDLVPRSSLGETYARIIADLQEAVGLLPAVADFRSRPSRAAAHALLARVYLLMGDYGASLSHAESSLADNPSLLDYSRVNPNAAFPFSGYQEEVLFQSMVTAYGFLFSNEVFVEGTLLASYAENDLRRRLFFSRGQGGSVFRGNYTGQVFLFSGLATDEVRITRMECLARLGRLEEAASAYNEFVESRFADGSFEPLGFGTVASALDAILLERRKSLLYRGVRWMDLRRLNQDPNRAVTLSRNVGDAVFELRPGSLRYTFPIPDSEISLNGIEQNPRD